ncbi:MAG: PorP/SprF family type IX secretion system membrane protein [Bacteroidetes bacterium]|nr:PorP/SprF family type IX secretion system membrane protein [Bacteroidota bacterium]
MMRKILPVIVSLLFAYAGNAQDIHFSQFYENTILRNPGLTGIFSGDYKAGINYRTQWGNISVPFNTVYGTAETRIAMNDVGDYVSIGLAASYDKAGSISFNSFQVYPAVAYNKSMEDDHNTYLSVGFAAGYIQRSVDVSKMTFTSQYVNGSYSAENPSGENVSNTSLKNYDLGAGIALNSSMGANNAINYYLGVSAFHVLQPKQAFQDINAFARNSMKLQGNLGFKANITRHYSFTMHVNYSNQKPYQEWIGGGMLGWRAIGENAPNFSLNLGLFYRLNDAFIPTLKLDYRTYSVTVSYDINSSSLRPATSGMGGYEVSLFARGILKKDKPNNQKCPAFEDVNNVLRDE